MTTDLTVAQAADAARVSTRTIMRKLATGQLSGSYKADGQWMIPAAALDVLPADAVVVAPPPRDTVTMPAAQPVVPPRILLSVDQVAAALGVTPYAVRHAVRRGELAGYRWGPGGAVVVPRAELARLAGVLA